MLLVVLVVVVVVVSVVVLVNIIVLLRSLLWALPPCPLHIMCSVGFYRTSKEANVIMIIDIHDIASLLLMFFF